MQKYYIFPFCKKILKKFSLYLCHMENRLGKQLSIYIVLLAILWILLLVLQVGMAKRFYSHRKDLFAVKLNEAFDAVFDTIDEVDYNTVDSLVALTLSEHAIPYPYDLGVYCENEQQFKFLTKNADQKALVEKGFRYNVFRIKDDEAHLDTILLHFPSLVKRLRLEKIWTYFLIFSLLILLLVCFLQFFYITLKYRKINLFREKMAHFITHELKTPLTTINLSAQLLKDNSVVTDEEAKQSYLNVITEETKVLESLVNEVLTVFKLEYTPGSNLREVEIHPLLNEVCKVNTPRFDECGAEVCLDFKADCDVVLGNDTHLFNTFSNLVDNAIKYSKGKLKLTISTQNQDDTLQINIADNGIGISKENLPLIFEPFSRLNTEDAHYVKGFGMGLDYVKHVVEYHKGTVTVKSKLGEGTTFTVTLPLHNK